MNRESRIRAHDLARGVAPICAPNLRRLFPAIILSALALSCSNTGAGVFCEDDLMVDLIDYDPDLCKEFYYWRTPDFEFRSEDNKVFWFWEHEYTDAAILSYKPTNTFHGVVGRTVGPGKSFSGYEVLLEPDFNVNQFRAFLQAALQGDVHLMPPPDIEFSCAYQEDYVVKIWFEATTGYKAILLEGDCVYFGFIRKHAKGPFMPRGYPEDNLNRPED